MRHRTVKVNSLVRWVKAWFLKLLVVISQAVNALILNGEPDQTLSSRAYSCNNVKGWSLAEKAINFVFFWDKQHCYNSWMLDLEFSNRIIERSKV